VIVGAPQDGTPYDLEVTWTLHRGSEFERQRVDLPGTTGSHVLDAPFGAGETARTARWQADVALTWQGQTLRQAHTSAPLFPAITTWRAVVYDADESPIPLERAMEDQEKSEPALAWQPYVQQVEGLRNLVQPHAVLFYREYGPQLRAGAPLAGYLAVTVHSPDERTAVLRYVSPGPVSIYLNGQKLDIVPREDKEEGFFALREIKQTVPFRLHEGGNRLTIDTRPPQTGHPYWAFGAAFASPEGDDVMTDLAYG
jgi:hypothetical protein